MWGCWNKETGTNEMSVFVIHWWWSCEEIQIHFWYNMCNKSGLFVFKKSIYVAVENLTTVLRKSFCAVYCLVTTLSTWFLVFLLIHQKVYANACVGFCAYINHVCIFLVERTHLMHIQTAMLKCYKTQDVLKQTNKINQRLIY